MGKPRRERRTWSSEQKRQIVSEVGVDGASMSLVARRYDVNANLVFKWLRDPRYNPALQESGADDGTPMFLPVELYNPNQPHHHHSDDANAKAEQSSSASTGVIELNLANGHCVSFPCDMEKESLLYLMRGMAA